MKKFIIAMMIALSMTTAANANSLLDMAAQGAVDVFINTSVDDKVKKEETKNVVKANSSDTVANVQAWFGFGRKSTPEYKAAKAKADAEYKEKIAARKAAMKAAKANN